MLSLQDCLDLCDLDCGEVEAIAEHEHVPAIIATELAQALVQSQEGVLNLHRMVLENLEQAASQGCSERVCQWARVYAHLQRTHPLCLAGAAPQQASVWSQLLDEERRTRQDSPLGSALDSTARLGQGFWPRPQ